MAGPPSGRWRRWSTSALAYLSEISLIFFESFQILSRTGNGRSSEAYLTFSPFSIGNSSCASMASR